VKGLVCGSLICWLAHLGYILVRVEGRDVLLEQLTTAGSVLTFHPDEVSTDFAQRPLVSYSGYFCLLVAGEKKKYV